jgi:hypothetical protein
MVDIFVVKLDQIQPCKLYVDSEKLSNVLKNYDRFKPDLLEPLPVKKLGDEVVLTDGHTIALAAYLRGISEVRAYWDDAEADWEAYQICVDWCKKEGVHSVADLKDRVVSAKDYDLLWSKRCEEMVRGLEAKRAKISLSVMGTEDQELIESK